jgi:hypothetical protein
VALGKAQIAKLLVYVLWSSGCVRWRPLASEVSPDGRYEAILKSNKIFVDSVLAVDLRSGSSRENVYVDRFDRCPVYVQIAWNKDSGRFGVLEFDKCAPRLVFAYDVDERRQIDSALILDDIRKALIKRHQLEHLAEQPSFDPIDWVRNYLRAGDFPLLD